MVVFYDERGLGCPDYSRLDYCNSLLAGVADVHLCRLQSVQNAAARLVFGARRHDHMTPILATLHWLPVRERVTFKTTATVLVWKCLHDVAPHYLVDLCVPTAATAGRRQSRFAVSGVMVPWTRTSTGQLRCLWPRRPRYPEPTTMHQPPTVRTVAIFIQGPALKKTHLFQHVVVVCVSRTAVRRCCDCCEFGADYKCPKSIQLNSSTYQNPTYTSAT